MEENLTRQLNLGGVIQTRGFGVRETWHLVLFLPFTAGVTLYSAP